MKCVICQGEEIEVRELMEEVKIENNIIFVPVSIPVCKNCGERYYDRQTMLFLEEIEEKVKNKEIELKEIGKVLTLST
jgi:YgiT-type zinc finger domain-containing protein